MCLGRWRLEQRSVDGLPLPFHQNTETRSHRSVETLDTDGHTGKSFDFGGDCAKAESAFTVERLGYLKRRGAAVHSPILASNRSSLLFRKAL
jgi:hypothetical protein